MYIYREREIEREITKKVKQFEIAKKRSHMHQTKEILSTSLK